MRRTFRGLFVGLSTGDKVFACGLTFLIASLVVGCDERVGFCLALGGVTTSVAAGAVYHWEAARDRLAERRRERGLCPRCGYDLRERA